MSPPDFFFIYVIARLDRAICLSPPSDFPDTPVKPEYDNNKRHHPPGPFLPLPGLLFFMSLPDLIGQSVYHRRLIFQILRSSRSMTTKNVITRLALSCHCPVFYFLCHCSAFYFMSPPGFFFIYVIARLDRAICLSPPSDFPDTPVKPKYDNKKRHHPTGSFLPLPGFLFFMSLFGFLFYVIARLLFYLCHCPA